MAAEELSMKSLPVKAVLLMTADDVHVPHRCAKDVYRYSPAIAYSELTAEAPIEGNSAFYLMCR
jgi:hypothetical protein